MPLITSEVLLHSTHRISSTEVIADGGREQVLQAQFGRQWVPAGETHQRTAKLLDIRARKGEILQRPHANLRAEFIGHPNQKLGMQVKEDVMPSGGYR